MGLSTPNPEQLQPWFIATESFDSRFGANWEGFKRQTTLEQLTELVSLDSMLCPSVLPDIKPEYWPHMVDEDFMLQFFTDLPFLLSKISEFDGTNLLCVFRNPSAHPVAPLDILPFRFLGYDLLEKQASVSALSNCGGFPDVFANQELNQFGLLMSHDRALEVQHNLSNLHPEEPQADCDVWAIFRASPTK
jgi:hypothetical protein